MFNSYFDRKAPSNFILDTSVLVKPSQIHPDRDRYIKLLNTLQRNNGSMNRLGVPVARKLNGRRDIHAENLLNLKKAFRKKHTPMLYKSDELI
mmetsp:Transcript_44642/g.59226  ORF Transcript_44642/g.59226 Transcript_44642/m.59226 type:complete len:93 (+) Transcript_44642:1314-1592(+)